MGIWSGFCCIFDKECFKFPCLGSVGDQLDWDLNRGGPLNWKVSKLKLCFYSLDELPKGMCDFVMMMKWNCYKIETKRQYIDFPVGLMSGLKCS